MTKSSLTSFLDQSKTINVQFFHAQSIISELDKINSTLEPIARELFHHCVLNFGPLSCLIKQKENLGLYIDSLAPKWSFRLEQNSLGQMRSLIFPSQEPITSLSFQGQVKIVKTYTHGAPPYSSIFNLDENNTIFDLSDLILDKSYQVQGTVLVDMDTLCSALIMKLPDSDAANPNKEEPTQSELKLEAQASAIKEFLAVPQNFHKEIESLGFQKLSSKDIEFFCPCSKERMIGGLKMMSENDLKDAFQGDSAIEVTCDYCQSTYEISSQEVF